MIKRSSVLSEKKLSTINMKISTEGTDINIQVRVNSDRANEIHDYMVDKLGNESPLSRLWSRMLATMSDIMESDEAVKRAAPEVMADIIRHILIEEFKSDIYEIASR